MYCTACGTKNPAESNFCKQCGLRIDRPVPVKISEEAFDRALPEEEQVSALLERAYRLRADGDTAGAIALCEEALSRKADSTSAHSLLGQLYAQQGERDRAVREYERVLQLNPGSIADRVKLDELRTDEESGERPKAGRTRIVFTEQKFTPENARNGLAIAGIALALMLAGGALALKFRPQASTPSPQPLLANGNLPSGVGLQKTNPDPVNSSQESEAQRIAQSSSQAGTGTAPGTPFGSAFTTPFSQNTASMGASPRQTDTPFRNLPGAAVPTGVALTRPPTLNVKEVKNPPKVNPTRSENDNRVRLPDDEGITDDGKGNIVIRVNASNSGANAGGGNKTNSGDNGTGYGKIRFESTPDPGKGTKPPPDVSHLPSSEALTHISMGNDFKMKGDYNRAIQAYQKARAGAGDELAKVFELIARCFQEKGERASAANNYEKAIVEWQKLISAGRQVDLARSSIRVCENGIKICRSEQ